MIKKLHHLFLLALPMILAGVFGQSAYADYMDVVKMTGLYECYTDGYMNETVKSIDTGLSLKDIVKDSDQIVYLPNGVGHEIDDNDLSCRELIGGYSGLIGGKWSPLIPGANSSGNMSQENARTALRALGYEPINAGADTGLNQPCFQYDYSNLQHRSRHFLVLSTPVADC